MYKPTVGIEVHVELKTKSKMFCSCPNGPDERRPNVNICPICLGHPGVLPVVNEEAVKKTIKTGLVLNCQIEENSFFERKNYFYPDLPKGYQISQYNTPLCKDGYLEIPIIEETSELKKSKIKNQKSKTQIKNKKIRIRRVHLEEDTGRLIHEKDYSLVDFNRAGIPLMELVTEPDITSAEEARKFAQELHLIMHYLDVSDADMEKGQMRVEVNISLIAVNRNSRVFANEISANSRKLGTKVEIKNLNSFRTIEKAIKYEIQRQTELLKKKKKIVQETRGWDDVKGITVSQREKEEAHDYRYFPEPDLPPLHITKETIEKIKAEIPELPRQKRERLKKEYQLDEKSVEIFVYNKDLGEFFEKVILELSTSLSRENLLKLIRLASNYIITDLQGLLKEASAVGSFRQRTGSWLIAPENFAQFISLIYEGKISSKIAKIVLKEMFKTGTSPSRIIEEKGLIQITDEKGIEEIAKEVISKNSKAVQDFKKGKINAFQFLIGQIMAQTRNKANPEVAKKILKKLL